ncbi:hypothetical protein EDB85DRAFT_1896310 [Lactarius pseudohatsudake]|nr:hypothetical protein EDB85DRAFT_1896310 [Lactarius pseudohatsudake]
MAGSAFRHLNSCLFCTHVEQVVVRPFFSLTVEDEESSILSKAYQREYAQRKRAPGRRKVSKAERALLEERHVQRRMLMAVEDLPQCSKAAEDLPQCSQTGLTWGYKCSLIVHSQLADPRRTQDMIEEEERAGDYFNELKLTLQMFCLFPWIDLFQMHAEDFIQERLSEAASIIAAPGIEEEDSLRLHGLRRLVAGAIQEVELIQQPGYAATCAMEDGAIVWHGRGYVIKNFSAVSLPHTPAQS